MISPGEIATRYSRCGKKLYSFQSVKLFQYKRFIQIKQLISKSKMAAVIVMTQKSFFLIEYSTSVKNLGFWLVWFVYGRSGRRPAVQLWQFYIKLMNFHSGKIAVFYFQTVL